jgi:YidC/Oxa1 family membrane protein insertase
VDLYSFAPIAAVLDGAHFLITSLIALLEPVTGAASAALAIVLITALVRASLIPASRATVRGEVQRRRLAPRIAELRKRYANNPELLQRKTMELYSSEKVSPFAGCLPALIQAPVLSILYGLFVLAAINGHANSLLTESVVGVPLGTSLVSLVTGGAAVGQLAVFGVLLVAIGAVAWFSRRATQRYLGAADDVAPGMRSVMSVMSWMPFLTVIFAAIVPLAATLYLAVSTTWTLVERQLLRRALDS